MKKLILAIVICVFAFSLSACNDESSETINSGVKVQQTEGNYFLYKTRSDSEYLTFLETFDEDKYEIIDISTGMKTYVYGESYMVTYKKK